MNLEMQMNMAECKAVLSRLMAPPLRICLAFFALAAVPASAQLIIDVTTTAGKQIPIAIMPFAKEDAAPQNVTPVVGSNLARTGLFRIANTTGITKLPTSPSEINFLDWTSRGMEALVIGSIEPMPDGRYNVSFRLFDVAKQMQTAGMSYTVGATQLRATAHKISDEIYEKLLGERGVFSTKIAYVLKRGNTFELQVADADGFNPQAVLKSVEPIRSPKWSPDGTKIVVGLYCDTDMGYDESIVLDAKTGAAGANPTAADVTWAPTGGQMVGTGFEDTDTATYIPAIYDDSGVLLRWLPAGDGSTSMIYPVFSKDGANIAVSTYDEWGSATTPAGLWTIPAAGGARRLVLRGVDIKPMQWR